MTEPTNEASCSAPRIAEDVGERESETRADVEPDLILHDNGCSWTKPLDSGSGVNSNGC